MRCYVFDVDGTLADLGHRLHLIQKEPKDWDAFFDACGDDAPIGHVLDLCWAVYRSSGIIFVTGRPERCHEATVTWLRKHGAVRGKVVLYMRRDGDHRPDYLVKADLLAHMRADGWEPIMAFDARTQVVKMWRAAGVPCAQVAEGDF